MKLGEYVRTNEGNIFKITDYDGDDYKFDIGNWKLIQIEETYTDFYEHNDNHRWVWDNTKSHGENITDVIEVGDLVNGETVSKVDYAGGVFTLNGDMYYYPEEIKTILTKEQYDKVVYHATN